MLVGAVVQAREHRPAATGFAHLVEAVALVEAQGRVVRLDAQRDLLEAVLLRLREQRREQLLAVAPAAARRNDCDRQLRRLLVDEAVARLTLFEEPVPRRSDVACIAVRNHGGVAGAAPAHDVTLYRALHGVLRRALAPVVRVMEHVAEKACVVPAARANHETRSCASWIRFPSGS